MVLGDLHKQKLSRPSRNSKPRPVSQQLLAIGVCMHVRACAWLAYAFVLHLYPLVVVVAVYEHHVMFRHV